MKSSSSCSPLALTGTLALLLLTSANQMAAAEDTCSSDSDCDRGFTCEEQNVGVCAEISCPTDDADCQQMCSNDIVNACVPLSDCTADDECPEGFTCAEQVRLSCPAGEACVGDGSADCPAIDEAFDCEETTLNTCMPQWAAECHQDSDCGPGFDCELRMDCTCSNAASPSEPPEMSTAGSLGTMEGGGTGGSAGGDADDSAGGGDPDAPVQDPDCTCEPADYGFCQLKDLPCDSDDDCEDGLLCREDPNATICGGIPRVLPEDGDIGAMDSTDDDCAVNEVKRCLPRYYAMNWAFDATAATSAEVAPGGVAFLPQGPAARGDEGEEAVSAQDDSDGSALQDNTGEGATPNGESGNVGCSVGQTRAAAGQLAWLGLPLLLLRRRRAQR